MVPKIWIVDSVEGAVVGMVPAYTKGIEELVSRKKEIGENFQYQVVEIIASKSIVENLS